MSELADAVTTTRSGVTRAISRLVDNGWVDLRARNWHKWRERAAAMLQEVEGRPGPDQGSRFDTEPGSRRLQLRPGRMAAWIFRKEDRGERVKQ